MRAGAEDISDWKHPLPPAVLLFISALDLTIQIKEKNRLTMPFTRAIFRSLTPKTIKKSRKP